MFILKFITRKPAGAAFAQAQNVPGTNQTLNQWTLLQPGVLSARARRPGKNILVRVVRCTDQAAADAYLAALEANGEYQARAAHNAANNITQRLVKLQVVA
jgi:hypothetical protein